MKRLPILIALAALAATAACSDKPPDVDCSVQGRYFPLRTGGSWTFQVVDDNGTTSKTQTVGALEDVGGQKAGTMAYRLTTQKPGGMVISWQEDTGTAVVRHREQDLAGATQTDEYYTPFHTRVDESAEHTVEGASWTETYMELVTDMATGAQTMTTKTDTWMVEAVDDAVSVPAGDFCALKVRRMTTVDGATSANKTYWFSRGVGKIREETTNGNETEELVSYTP